MLERLFADCVLVVHLLFVVFVVAGGLFVQRWPKLAILHLPAACWGAFVELSGWVCPLTPLENRLRHAAGQAGYTETFIEHYLLPVLYPAGLTRDTQFALAGLVIVTNLGLYAWLLYGRRQRRADDY
ncbi:MAG: DUF2784 domain-containing protein [Candidatus Accumulibacter sp.]|uniref:DUF2784 domain-containing protein n=1 Tax=Accumulibacter sp. TaxID=2053492 RepID=UPI002879DD2F|nr:DUF2784 domain-containing protein [Accumulibacter sp.]MDS4015315.1 DUF2784 domain-containing protein [Accumulibacter sp.]